MLDYARQRAIEVLKQVCRAVLVTSGPAGVQASEVACEAAELEIYLLVPRTSDHLFNLEHKPRVMLLSARWEVRGKALVQSGSARDLDLLHTPEAAWCALVRAEPDEVQIRRAEGWGYSETIEL